MPKVSVIIPTYNGAKYLPEALDSVLGQTYRDFEVIVIDDGSTDSTESIVRKYCDAHKGVVQYFCQKNRGPAAARNMGICKAIGEYIAFLDADDIWLGDKLEKQMAALGADRSIDFIYCDNHFVDADKKILPNYVRVNKFIRGDIAADLFCSHIIMTPAVIIKKKCFEKTGLFDEGLIVGEDYDLLLRVAYYFKADFVPEKLWKRRVMAGSLSRKDFILDARNDLKTLVKFLKQNPGFYAKYKERARQRLSDYHFSFAYQCLENGKNILAFFNLLASVRYKFSWKALKNIVICACPIKIRNLLKVRFA